MRVIDHLACDLVLAPNRFDIFYRSERLAKPDAIVPRVGTGITHESTLVLRQLEMKGAFSIAYSDAILRAKDKFGSLQILASEGINIPKSMAVNHEEIDEYLIEEHFRPPVVLKMLEGTHGKGVALIDTIRDLRSMIEMFQLKKHRVMIQAFIEESVGKDIRVIVVGDQVVASMERTASEGEFRSNLHMGGSAQKIVLTEEEMLLAKRATKAIGLGFAGVDILRTKNKSYVLEVNASPGLEGIESVTGIDIADKVVRYIERQVRRRK